MSAANPQGNEPGSSLNPVVFFGSAVAIVVFAVWAMIVPEGASGAIGALVGWTSRWFGWFYILLATVILAFVIFLALSRYGSVKLGPAHSKPDFGLLSWAAMLFAAGIGTDLMFFAVSEPVTQYLSPPTGEGESVTAAREAAVWTIYHYGISGWGMYALMGIALAYFSYRLNLPLNIRSSLFPLIGKRIYGPIGHVVDLAAIIGTIFGIATTLGIGVVLLNYGLKTLYGIPEGLPAQIGLVLLAVGVAMLSAVTGIAKGIRRLSELNVLLAIGLIVFILIAGPTVFLLNAFVLNIGDYLSSFPNRTLETFAFVESSDWLQAWTLFFWAWWIAWAAFVGLFLARISYGRTIRQFVLGTMTIPFMYVLMWVSVLGNASVNIVRNGNTEFGQTAMNTPAEGFYLLIQQYPAFLLVGTIATIVGLLFYITSADSGALVMANLSSYLRSVRDDAAASVRIFWAMAIGLLTLAMLIVGGVTALQNATIIMGLPFAFVLIAVMVGLYKALRVEGLREDSRLQSLPARLTGRTSSQGVRTAGWTWRQRLKRTMTFADYDAASRFLSAVARPALDEVGEELRGYGVETRVHEGTDESGLAWVELTADLGAERPFRYGISPQQAWKPVYGDRSLRKTDVYYRLEVYLREGGQGYDVMDYTTTQLVDDVLDHYEQHVEFLRLHAEAGAAT
jgi:choline/glycine/proline betaine transport protein